MIYFLRDDATQFIKMGFTAGDADNRARTLQTGCPGTLVILLEIEGSEKDEASWHDRFASARARGEWFRPVPELLLAIAEAKVAQLEEEKAQLQAAFDALLQRVNVARAQLGSLSVFAPDSVAIGLRNIKDFL